MYTARLPGPEPREWLVVLAGVGVLAVVLGATAFMLWGSGAHLVGRDETEIGARSGREHAGAIWLGLVMLLTLVGHAALRLFIREESYKWLVAESQERLAMRYGIDAGLFWPRLAAVLPDATRRRVRDYRTGADASVQVWRAYVVAAALSCVQLALARGWPAALLLVPFACVGLVLASRRSAWAAAASYADVLETTIELHRFDLLRALGQELPSSSAEERERFKDLAAFLRGERPVIDYRHRPEDELAGLGDDVERLREVLTDPVLVNWSGHVGARLDVAGGRYRLETCFGDAVPDMVHARVDIRDGRKAALAVFALDVDGEGLAVPVEGLEVRVPVGEPETRAEFDLGPVFGDAAPSVSIQVLQGNRLIQVLNLHGR